MFLHVHGFPISRKGAKEAQLEDSMVTCKPLDSGTFARNITLGLLLLSACGSEADPMLTGQPAGAVSGTSSIPPAPAGATAAAPLVTPPSTAAGASAAIAGSNATGAAGANAAAGAGTGTGATTTIPAAVTGAAGAGAVPAMAMNECGLHTKYAGDEYCILPPPPDKGFQLHIGPTDYDNPELAYILAPGQELTTDTFSATSGNDKEVYFYYRQYRMRPGAHHNIITSGNGGGDSGLGQRIGTTNTLSEDYPKGGIIAPENKSVGIKMAPHTRITVSLHSINTSEKPELREMWVNFWYRDPTEVKDPVKEIFSIAPMAGIPPHGDVVVKGSCSVDGDGRMLWAYGHRHANNVSFTVWRSRSGKKDLVYQGYNWEEPITFDYSSTVMNPVPDTAPNVEGAWSGILDIKAGDQFLWECHVVNKTSGTLNFTNNTFTGEMCILDAETVGGGCR